MKSQLLYVAVLLAAVAAPANAELRAWLDSTHISPGDTVQLTLAHDGRTGTQPDLAPLRQDFDIIGQSTSTNVQIVNGSVSSSTQLQLTLSPKHAGRLAVPSVRWDSDHSAPLTLDVSAAANGSASGNPGTGATSGNRVMLETEVSPKDPYVQAAVEVTLRLYMAVPVSNASVEFGDTDAAIVRRNGPDGNDTQERNGVTYQVLTRHYLLFPQHSGQLRIPGPTLAGEIPVNIAQHRSSDPFADLFAGSPFSGMLGASKPIRLHADPIQLDVRPRPAGANASYWLPARRVSLEASWHPAQAQAHVGDPITVDLDLKALGLTAAQLPDLSTQLNLPPDLKAYPDQPVLKDNPQSGAILGERQQSVALIADRPGRFTIPDLHLTWWDTHDNRAVEAVLPGRTLTIQPAAQASTAAPDLTRTPAPPQTIVAPSSDRAPRQSASPTGSSSGPSLRGPWPWISCGFALLWLVTLAAWLRASGRRGRSTTPESAAPPGNQADRISASAAKSAFQQACRENDAPGARRSLLAWVNCASGKGPRVRGLNALAATVRDPRLAELLHALDRACYAGDTWNGAALGAALRELPKSEPQREHRALDLAQLYH